MHICCECVVTHYMDAWSEQTKHALWYFKQYVMYLESDIQVEIQQHFDHFQCSVDKSEQTEQD